MLTGKWELLQLSENLQAHCHCVGVGPAEFDNGLLLLLLLLLLNSLHATSPTSCHAMPLLLQLLVHPPQSLSLVAPEKLVVLGNGHS